VSAETRWGADLFKIAPGPFPLAIAARVAAAAGIPLVAGCLAGHVVAGVIGAITGLLTTMADIGTTRASRLATMAAATLAILVGGTIGAKLGGTTYADEVLVLASAAVAGWVSVSHPGIAAVARFGAIATAGGAGMQFADPMVAVAALAGGALAIGVALVAWRLVDLPPAENLMDWRAALHRALAGTGAGPWFAICFAAACAIALLAAEQLGVSRPYWATITVMMVMRREGLESLGLVVQYMVGTLGGIVAAAAIVGAVEPPLALALVATASAACVRPGFALNPGLGFTAFTVFLVVAADLALHSSAMPVHLLSTRLYDVTVGCALALAGTLAARATRRAAAPSRGAGA
jgi:hypothetical protein